MYLLFVKMNLSFKMPVYSSCAMLQYGSRAHLPKIWIKALQKPLGGLDLPDFSKYYLAG